MNLADMTPQQLRDEIERLARINRENCERILQRDDALSAIRALVQQWREPTDPWDQGYEAGHLDCADQLAALCPASDMTTNDDLCTRYDRGA